MGPRLAGVCLDTGLLIQFLRGKAPGNAVTEAAVRQFPCYITAITVYELLFGVARAGRDIGEGALLRLFTVLSLDEAAARRAARLHNALVRQGQDIGIKDVLIAAICLIHDLPLLTLNTRHFERVPDLIVLKPEDVLS